eukprot:Phypoly_transcript_24475.p1 GENE.Phypoly_transcript_24475~~Phypoly_transcript_24475.p1  ORF type:complete len:149 (+),score=12.74 Phypoly_transcript_24475:98-544(+)
MLSSKLIVLLFCFFFAYSQASNIYVQNKCGSAQNVVLRGAWGVQIASGTIPAGGQWSHEIDANNCNSCNIATFPGNTLLAEFSVSGGKIWWNLSTDAGYAYPPFRFFSSQPNGPNMYCGGPGCPDGTPGDSHINNCPDQYDLYVQYCG